MDTLLCRKMQQLLEPIPAEDRKEGIELIRKKVQKAPKAGWPGRGGQRGAVAVAFFTVPGDDMALGKPAPTPLWIEMDLVDTD